MRPLFLTALSTFFSLIPQRIPLAFTIHQPNYLTSTVTAVRFGG